MTKIISFSLKKIQRLLKNGLGIILRFEIKKIVLVNKKTTVKIYLIPKVWLRARR